MDSTVTIFTVVLHFWRQHFHPQPKDAPWDLPVVETIILEEILRKQDVSIKLD
jgi:hypothetical protein